MKIDFEKFKGKQRKTKNMGAHRAAVLFYRKQVLTHGKLCGIKGEHAFGVLFPILKVCVSNVKVFCGFPRKSRSGRTSRLLCVLTD